MKKLWDCIQWAAIVTVLLGGMASLCYLKFVVWKKIHPQAPTWTFFLDK